jgi:hypothetical protein
MHRILLRCLAATLVLLAMTAAAEPGELEYHARNA